MKNLPITLSLSPCKVFYYGFTRTSSKFSPSYIEMRWERIPEVSRETFRALLDWAMKLSDEDKKSIKNKIAL